MNTLFYTSLFEKIERAWWIVDSFYSRRARAPDLSLTDVTRNMRAWLIVDS